ncbi:MAG: NAD(P)-dependent oxidoreductase [Holophaga sp.]|nr:NAD(P)-dependent oxidoreductase [Holophaga sp.]
MRKLAVIHYRVKDWLPALREAEPRLDIRGWHPREALDEAWLADAEGLFTWILPSGLLERMPRLAWIQNSGAGLDHLVGQPIPAAIPITRADGQFGFWMARYTVGHLLAEAQAIDACAAAQAERRWASKLVPEDLTGRLALVHGFGRIGRQIGRALRELGMEVHGFVRTPRADDEFPVHAGGELGAWLGRARVLVLCAPLTDATRGMADAGLLAQANPGLTLVNVGRGELVRVPDLLAALDRGQLGRAVLDVFPHEPLEPDSPLWNHPRVVVTPHHAGPSTPRMIIPDILENLRRFAEGRPILDAVDRTVGY